MSQTRTITFRIFNTQSVKPPVAHFGGTKFWIINLEGKVKTANCPIYAGSQRCWHITVPLQANSQQSQLDVFLQEIKTLLLGLKVWTSCGDGCCFGTIRSAALWSAERILVIPVLTKTNSRLYCEYQQGIQQDFALPGKAKPRQETELCDEPVPVRLAPNASIL